MIVNVSLFAPPLAALTVYNVWGTRQSFFLAALNLPKKYWGGNLKKKAYIHSLLELFSICDAFQEKVTYVGKMNSEFSPKLGSGHPHQHVPEEYKVYCSIEPEKGAYKVQSLKNVLLRKSLLKFLEDIKTKKIYFSALPTLIWLWDVWSMNVLILQSSSKSVEQNANFKKCTFEKIMF